MRNLKELSISDLKSLYDYFRLIIEDAVSDGGKIEDENAIIETEPKLTAINEELNSRIKAINF